MRAFKITECSPQDKRHSKLCESHILSSRTSKRSVISRILHGSKNMKINQISSPKGTAYGLQGSLHPLVWRGNVCDRTRWFLWAASGVGTSTLVSLASFRRTVLAGCTTASPQDVRVSSELQPGPRGSRHHQMQKPHVGSKGPTALDHQDLCS